MIKVLKLMCLIGLFWLNFSIGFVLMISPFYIPMFSRGTGFPEWATILIVIFSALFWVSFNAVFQERLKGLLPTKL